jgi:hypothetical protein
VIDKNEAVIRSWLMIEKKRKDMIDVNLMIRDKLLIKV